MNLLRNLLLQDIGRKVLALGIAVLIWWRVSASLESLETFPFRVVVTDGTPAQHEIKINVPDGWILVDPKPNETIDIRFYGNARDRQDFLNTQCAAIINPTISEPGNQDSTSFVREPAKFGWLRQSQATALFLKAGNPPVSFKFEKHDYGDYLLESKMVDVTGQPESGYSLKRTEATFSPNAVEIHGPIGVLDLVESLQIQLLLFKPLALPDGANQDVKRTLELSTQALEAGMWMVPPTFTMQIPVRAKAAEPVEWRPDKPVLIGQAPGGVPWTILAWTDAPWVATLEPTEGLNLQLDAQWLKRNIKLMVHLDQIHETAVEGYELLVDWHIVGEGSFENLDELQKLKHAIKVRPKPRDDRRNARTVTMHKEEG